MSPWRVLAPGDPVAKLVERAVIHEAAAARTRELDDAVYGGAVLAGQVVALCLGADANRVAAVGTALEDIRRNV